MTENSGKLEWSLLLAKLAQYAQTHEGQKHCLELTPDLTADEVNSHWQRVVPLKNLVDQGFSPPIGEVFPLEPLLKAAIMGQILEPKDFLDILSLLHSIKQVSQFVKDFSLRCKTLEEFKKDLNSLPQLQKDIQKVVDHEGIIKDEASPDLFRIRNEKRSLKQKIEHKLTQILTLQNQYIQDNFFTIRLERYVVPVSIDGRGRFQGSIVDTSSSGQTLFMEPAGISQHNQELQELELSEKLEILKILKKLSVSIAVNSDALSLNYEKLIELDVLSAQARFASKIRGNAVVLSPVPCFNLISARHPLLVLQKEEQVVPNTIELKPEQRCLIMTGPNAGGKTIVLKTLGLIQLMAKAGLLIPASVDSTLFLYRQIFVEMGDSQDLSADLSTFSGHIFGVNTILASANSEDLVLLDELGVGTEPQTAAALAQSIIEHLTKNDVSSVITTHFDNLKLLAMENSKYRNGSMEYLEEDFRPTYKLILDVPGQSYGLEVAKAMHLPNAIIERARILRGTQGGNFDNAIKKLSKAQTDFVELKAQLQKDQTAAQVEKNRWQQEVELLSKKRERVAQDIQDKYESQISKLQEDIRRLQVETKKSSTQDQQKDSLAKAKNELDLVTSELKSMASDFSHNLPGAACQYQDLKLGSHVHVISIKKDGVVSKLSGAKNEVEVECGFVKLKVPVKGLRILLNKKPSSQTKSKLFTKSVQSAGDQVYVEKVDLRGLTAEDALAKMWKALDLSVMRGDYHLHVLHGHGTNSLKTAIRSALQDAKDYSFTFRPGDGKEGGDGVTVVAFKG